MNSDETVAYKKLTEEKDKEQIRQDRITRRNGRLLYKLIGVLMMQFIITVFTFDWYYWQSIPVPDYYGCAIVILMCAMGAHMLMQKRIKDTI